MDLIFQVQHEKTAKISRKICLLYQQQQCEHFPAAIAHRLW